MFLIFLRYTFDMARDIQINLNSLFANTPYENKALTIGVALSGGRDSVALAHALKQAGASIVAINVEHGIRGQESVDDSLFVADFCNKQGIKLYSYSVNAVDFSKDNGYTLEQGARVLRYEIFDKALEEGKCDVIALAHHLDDQAETVLMRIVRGTGIKGLVGMKTISGKYVRPLLDYSREDIDAYIADNKLQYVDDKSNFDFSYTRNFLRAELARLKERFPSICSSFARLSRNASETEDFINAYVPDLDCKDGEIDVKIETLKNVVIGKRLILRACEILGVSQDIEERHFPLVFELCDAQNGKRISLTHGIIVHKDEDKLVFAREGIASQKRERQSAVNQCESQQDGESSACACCENALQNNGISFATGVYREQGVRIDLSSREEFSTNKKFVRDRAEKALFIDLDKLPKNAVLRGRKEGDTIEKFGGGRKSLGDFLTDKKVPLRKRNSLVVLAVDSEIYAVFGVDVSKKLAIDDTSVNICKLSLLDKSGK